MAHWTDDPNDIKRNRDGGSDRYRDRAQEMEAEEEGDKDVMDDDAVRRGWKGSDAEKLYTPSSLRASQQTATVANVQTAHQSQTRTYKHTQAPTHTQKHKHTSAQAHKHINTQAHKHTSTQTHTHSTTRSIQCTCIHDAFYGLVRYKRRPSRGACEHGVLNRCNNNRSRCASTIIDR